MSVEIDL